MTVEPLPVRFQVLSTPHLADACLRLGVPVRCGPSALRPVLPGGRVAGPVRPARHFGSVDVFLEALEGAAPGEVLVVDNGGRFDEACVGDLVTLEVQRAGLVGMVVWGLHRDTAELRDIGLPVFSLGALPTGPLRLDPQEEGALAFAQVGEFRVTAEDVVFADDDGVLFVPRRDLEAVANAAEAIRDVERRQAARMREGRSLREQTRFGAFLARRAREPGFTFRQHLRELGGAIEE
ncbi:RraA family protein [Deinococcus pimensis]|uniref:RraA family protein n=1 Tax=Deinococcus pimensis TaxID=309888 RepID=UPI0004867A24|nr:RraA family protein [Deinococcus pimensis]